MYQDHMESNGLRDKMKVELISYSNLGEKVCGIGARTCTSDKIPTKEDDTSKALRSAISSGHESILEHFTMTFAVSGVSRALTHQLVRHRIGISYSQQSQRYVNMEEFEYVTPASMDDRVIVESYDFFANRDVYITIRKEYADIMEYLRKCYKRMVDAGIPEEDARYILPNACCTNIIVTVNARELRHIAEERMCAKAQWEIRELVTEMVRQAKEVAPTLFADVGPECEKTHICYERNGCGRYPKHVVIE